MKPLHGLSLVLFALVLQACATTEAPREELPEILQRTLQGRESVLKFAQGCGKLTEEECEELYRLQRELQLHRVRNDRSQLIPRTCTSKPIYNFDGTIHRMGVWCRGGGY